MKLIVDVSESDYEVIINHCDDYVKSLYNEPEERCILAVKNGTPLDKHDEEIIAETVESIWGKPPYTELLDNLTADLESLREPTEPHLVDYRYHRNDMLDMVLGVIERYK